MTKKSSKKKAWSKPSQKRLITKLVKVWRAQDKNDLHAIFNFGTAVNEHLQKLTDAGQQDDCTAFQMQLARSIGLSVDEVRRMRQFAETFESYEAFRKIFPHVRTWTGEKQGWLSGPPCWPSTGPKVDLDSVRATLDRITRIVARDIDADNYFAVTDLQFEAYRLKQEVEAALMIDSGL